MLEEAEASSAASGDAFTRTHALWYLSILEWLAGRWQLALAHAATANDVTEQLWEHTMYVGRFRALIETDLGLVEQARASAEGGLAYARSSSQTNVPHPYSRGSRPTRIGVGQPQRRPGTTCASYLDDCWLAG